MKRLITPVLSVLLIFLSVASAQQPFKNHAIPIGRGAGVSGYNSVGPCNAAVPIVGAGASSDPACHSGALGTMAVQNANNVAITGGAIGGMPSPSISSDVATKGYVDLSALGLRLLAASRLATAAVLPNSPTYSNGASGVGATLTAGSNTTLTVDGVIAAVNNIILVKDQAAPAQNGQYYVSAAGSGGAPWVLTRCTAAVCGVEFDTAATMLQGSNTYITAGVTNAQKSFALTATTTTVGTTAVVFTAIGAGSQSSLYGPKLLYATRYGVRADNATDDTTAWGAVIDAANAISGGNVTIIAPAGRSLVPTLSKDITGVGIWIKCEGGPGDCILVQGTQAYVLNWTANFGGTESMGFDSTNGATANDTIRLGVANFVQINNAVLNTGIATFIHNISGSSTLINNMAGVPGLRGVPLILISGGSGVTITNADVYTGASLGASPAGRYFIKIDGVYDTVFVYNNTVQLFDSVIYLNASATPGVIQNIFVSGNTFDQNNAGITGTTDSGVISGLWIENNWITSYVTADSCLNIGGASGLVQVQIQGNRMPQCGAFGIAIGTTGGAKDIMIGGNNLTFSSANSIAGGAGILVLGGAGYDNISIVDNISGSNSYYLFLPTYGCVIDGIVNKLIVHGNSCVGSTANWIGQTFAHTNSIIEPEIGMAPVQATVAVGASPFTITNGARFSTYYVVGGTVSGIAQNGTNLSGFTSGSFQLTPNETLTITYSVAPTVTSVVH